MSKKWSHFGTNALEANTSEYMVSDFQEKKEHLKKRKRKMFYDTLKIQRMYRNTK